MRNWAALRVVYLCISQSPWPLPSLQLYKISAAASHSAIQRLASARPHFCPLPLVTETSNRVSKERERNFSVKSVLMKYLLLLSLCGIFPLPEISLLHLKSIFNILFCYETANRPIYIIKLPEYFIALGFLFIHLFLFWSGPRKKTNYTQTE